MTVVDLEEKSQPATFDDLVALARVDFWSFVDLTFLVLHPGQELVSAPYMDVVATLLESCAARCYRRVIINLPPRFRARSTHRVSWLTQLVILSAACQRDDRLVLPLPDRIKGGAAAKVVDSLIAKGLIEEVAAALDQPVWRESGDERRLTLVATAAAFEALGIAADEAPQGADEAPAPEPAKWGAKTPKPAPTAPATRKSRNRGQGTAKPKSDKGPRQNKGEAMLAMLQRPEGATIAEIVAAFGWLPHTTRAAMSCAAVAHATAAFLRLAQSLCAARLQGGMRKFAFGSRACATSNLDVEFICPGRYARSSTILQFPNEARRFIFVR